MVLLISKRPFGASFSVSSHPFNLANRPSDNLAYDNKARDPLGEAFEI